MNERFPFRRYVSIVLALIFSFFSLGELVAQANRMPSSTSIYLTNTFRNPEQWHGDLDQFQVLFFEVPSNTTGPLYLWINDPGEDNTYPDVTSTPGDFRYTVYGGSGAFSDSQNRMINYKAATGNNPRVGTQVADLTITAANAGLAAYNSGWYRLNQAISVTDGEKIGNTYYFKIVVEAMGNNGGAEDYKNGYQIALSTDAGTSPSMVPNVRAFAYNLCLAMDGNSTGFATVPSNNTTTWNLYPFIPDTASSSGYVSIFNYDADNLAGNQHFPTDAVFGLNATGYGSNPISLTPSADKDYIRNPFQISAYGNTKNTTWNMNLVGGDEVYSNVDTGINAVEVWATYKSTNTDSGTYPAAGVTPTSENFLDSSATLLRLYSQSYTPPAADHVVTQAADGTGLAGGVDTELVTLQIVDSTGANAPYSRNLYVSVSNSAQISEVNGVAYGPAATALVTTTTDGLATIKVKKAAAGSTVVSVESDGASGASALDDALASPSSNTTSTISFITDPLPTITSASSTVLLNTAGNTALPTISIADSVTANITMANGIYIRLPSALSASFDTTRVNAAQITLTVGGAGNGTVDSVDPVVSYPDSKTLYIAVTQDFDVTKTLTISGLQLLSGSYSPSSGKLEMEVSGGSSYASVDTKTITIQDANPTYVWNGTTSNWSTASNWSGGVAPSLTTDNVLIQAGVSVYPVLTAPVSIRNLTIQSGASLDVNGQSLTLNSGTFSNDGTFILTGGETLTGLTNDTNSGTVSYKTGSTSMAGLTNFYHLTFASGAHTLPATTTVYGNFTASGGTFTAGAGNVIFAGTTAQSVSSASSFNDVTISNSAGVTFATDITVGGNLTDNGSLTVSGSQNLTVTGNLTVPLTNSLTLSSGILTVSGTLSAPGTLVASGTINAAGNVTLGTFTAGTSTVVLNSSGTNRSFNPNGQTLNNLSVTSGTDTVTLGGNLTVSGLLNIAANQTFDPGTYTVSLNNVTSAGTFYVDKAGTLTASGTKTITGTVVYLANGAAPATVASLALGSNYQNLTLTVNGGAGNATVWQAGANLTVTGALTIGANATLDLQNNNLNLTGGSMSSSGLLKLSGNGNTMTALPSPVPGTVEFSGAGGTLVGLTSFTYLTISGTETTAADITVSNDFTIGVGGSLSLGTHNITVGGAITVNGTMSGTGSLLRAAGNLSGTYSTGGANIVFTGAQVLTADTVVQTSGGSITFQAAATVNGAYQLALTASAGTVSLGATMGGSTALHRLTVSAAGATVAASSFQFAGNTLIFNTPVVISTTTTLADSTGTISFNDTLTVNAGVGLTLQAPEIDFNFGANTVTGTATSTLTLQTNNGTDGVVLAGAGDTVGQLDLTATDLAAIAAGFQSVTIGGTSTGSVVWAGTATLNNATIISDDLSISSGTLTLADVDLTVAGGITGAGTLAATAAGAAETISVAGSFSPATFTAANSKVVMTSATAATLAGLTYYNLEINKAALANTVTAGGGITVSNAFTLTQGTFDAASYVHNIYGNWNSSSVNFALTGGTSTVTLKTPGATITTKAGDSFNHLDVESGGVLASNLSVGGNLTVGDVTAGVLSDSAGTYSLSVTGTSTVTAGASAISWSNANNAFTGSVSLTTTSNATLVSASALNLGATTIGGTLTLTNAGAISQSGAIAVTGATTIDAWNGVATYYAVNLSNVANDWSTISIPHAGAVTIDDTNAITVSGITARGNVSVVVVSAGAGNLLTVSGAIDTSATSGNTITLSTNNSNVVLGANLTTNNASITLSKAVTLSTDVTITSSGGAVLFSQTVDGAHNLTVTSGAGNVTFTGAVGSGTALGDVGAGTALSVTSTGTFASAAMTFSAARPVTVSADEINFSGAVSGTGDLVLQPGQDATNMNLGAAADPVNSDLYLTAAELTLITNGWNSLTFGRSTGTATLSISAALALNDAATFRMGGVGGIVTVAGALSAAAGNTGTFTFNAGNRINLNANVTTIGATVDFQSPTFVGANVTVDTTNAGGTPAGGTINFASTVNDNTSAHILTLNRGTGTLALSTTFGGTAPLGSLIFRSGDVNFTGAAGSIKADSISFFNATSTNAMDIGFSTGSAPYKLDDTEIATLSFSGASPTWVIGESAVQSGKITFKTVTAPTANTAITANSDSGAGQIELDNDAGGTPGTALSSAGSGTVTLNTGTGGIVVTNATSSTAEIASTGTVNLNTNSAGATSFGSATNRIVFASNSTVAINNASGSGSIYLRGTSSLTLGTVTTGNRTFDIDNDAVGTDDLTISGVLTNGTGNVNLNPSGTIYLNFNGTVINSGAADITLDSPVVVQQAANTIALAAGGTNHLLSLTSTLDGNAASTQPFTFSGTGSANLTISGAIGATTSLSALTLSGSTINVANIGGAGAGVGGATAVTATTILNFNGTTYNANQMTFTAPVGQNLVMNSGASTTFTSTNDNISFSTATILLGNGSNFSVVSAGGAIAATAGIVGNSSETVSLNATNAAGTRTVSVGGIGQVVANGVHSIALSGQGGITLSGDLSTDNTAGNSVTITGPVTLAPAGASVSINTSGNTGGITFSGATSTIDAAKDLTLDAGSGTISFGGAIGGGTRIGALTVSNASGVTFTGAVTAASFTQSAGTGTTVFSGAQDYTGNFAFTGSALTVNNSLNVGGTTTVTNAGLFTKGTTGAVTSTGAFTQNGAGSNSIGANITTTNTNLSFATPITLTATTQLSTGAGAGNITLSSTVDPTTASTEGLTLLAGTGTISVTGPVGTTRLGALTVTSTAGTTFTGAVTATSFTQSAGTGTTLFSGAQDYTGNFAFTGSALTVNNSLNAGGTTTVTNAGLFTKGTTGAVTSTGAFTQNGAGSNSIGANITTTNTNLSFLRAITLTATTQLSTGAGAGNITLSSTVDPTTASTEGLTLLAGTGTISVTGPVGATRLGALNVTSTAGTTFTGAVTAASFTQSAGTGTTLFSGAQDYTGNFAFTGSALTVNNSLNAGGTTTVTNAGLFTKGTTGAITSTGAFTQNGAGSNSIGANVTTTNTNLSFATAITLTATTQLSTGAGAGNITLSSTVNPTTASTEGLTLLAGTGTISVTGPVGATRLGALTVTSTAGTTFTGAVTAASFTQSAGTGTTVFSGAQDYTGNFAFTGSALTVNNSLNVGGTTTVTNAGLFTKGTTGAVTSTGAFTQNGAGSNSIGANVTTTNTNLSFATAITLTGNVQLSTSAGAGNIVLSVAVEGNTVGGQSLSLVGGTGNVTTSTLGTTTALSSVSASGTAISVDAVTTTGAQSYTGVTTLAGNLTSNTSGAISVTGTAALTNGITVTTSGAVGANISFSSTITNAASQTLALEAGNSGTVSVTGAIGTVGTPLTSLTINAAAGAPTGTIAVNDVFTSTTQTYKSTGQLTLNGSTYSVAGTGGADLLTFGAPVRITQASTSVTGGSGATDTVSFSSTLNANAAGLNLTVAAGSAPLNFTGIVGTASASALRPQDLTVSNAGLVTFSTSAFFSRNVSITAADVDLLGSFNVEGTVANGNLVINNSAPATTIGMGTAVGTMTLSNTDLQNIRTARTITIGLSGSQSGAITSTDAQLHTAVTNLTAVTINSDNGAGGIALTDSASAAFDTNANSVTLTLNSGTSGIAATANNLLASVSNPGTNLLTTNSVGATNVGTTTNRIRFSSTSGAVRINNASGSGTVAIRGFGALTIDGGASTVTGNRALDIDTSAGSFNLTLNQQISTGTGSVTLAPSGNINLNFAGTVLTATTADMTLTRPVVLQANSTVTNTVGNSANTIAFQSTVDSPVTAFSLTVTANATNVTFSGAIGSTNSLSALTVTSTNAIALANVGNSVGPVAGTSGALSVTAGITGGVTWNGTYYRTTGNQTWQSGTAGTPRALTTSAATSFITAGTLTVYGNFTSTAGNATLVSNDIDLGTFGTWDLGATRTLSFQTSTASTAMNVGTSAAGWSLDDTELARLNNAGSGFQKIVFGASAAQSGAITVQTVNLSAANAGTGVAVDFNSDAVGGSVTFDSNSNAAVAINLGTQNLTVNAYSTISAIENPPSNGHITTTGTISLNTNSSSGVRIGQGPVNAFPYSGSYKPIVINSGHTAVNVSGSNTSGVFIMGNGATVNMGTVAITGTLTTDLYNNTGIIYLTNNIASNGSGISFLQPVELKPSVGSSISIDTSTGGIAPYGALTFSSTLNEYSGNAAGTDSLSVTAGTAAVTFTGAVGATRAINNFTVASAGALTISAGVKTAGTGNVSLTHSGVLTLSDATSAADTTTFDFDLAGSFTEAGTGSVSIAADVQTASAAISFANAITLTGNVQLSTGAGAGNITLSSTVNPTTASTEGLTLLGGTGTISVTGPVGATRLGALTVTSAAGTTFTGAVTATSFTQSAGTGTSTFSGAQDYTGNFAFTGSALTVNNSLNVGGTTTITNAGTFTKNSTGAITSTGAFTQNGAGSNSIGANVTTTNTNLSFATAITLTATTQLSTGAGAGNITLSSTVDPQTASTQGLTLLAGTGTINVTGPVGTTRLGALTVTSSAGTTFTGAVTATSFTQSAGTGTTTFSAAQDYTGAFAFTGAALSIAALNAGSTVTVTNSGLFTTTGAITSTGAFTQNGAGANSLGANITTTNTNLSFATGITLASSVQLSTSAGAGNIALSSTVTGTTSGSENLTLVGGTGTVTVTGAIGATPIGVLTVSSGASASFAGTVSALALSIAPSVTFQNNVTVAGNAGTDTFSSGVSISKATAFLYSSANAMDFQSTLAIAGGGAVTLQTSNKNITVAGAISGPVGGQQLTISTGTSGVGDITLKGSVSLVRNLLLESDYLVLGNSVGPVSITVASIGTATPNGDITFHTDNLVQYGAASAINAGVGNFKLYPRSNLDIEIAATKTMAVRYYDTNFPTLTAATVLFGDASYSGNLFLGNQNATSVSYAVQSRTTGTTTVANWTSSNNNLTINASGFPAPVTFNVASGTIAVNLGSAILDVYGATTVPIDTAITANGGITFRQTVDGTGPLKGVLTLNANAANKTLVGTVGATNALGGLTTTGNGALTSTVIQGGTLATTGAISIGDLFAIQTSSLTISTVGSNLAFSEGISAGNLNLTLGASTAAGTFTVAAGKAVSNLGTGTGAAFTVQSGVTGLVRFGGTLTAANGLVVGGAGSQVRFDQDISITGSSTASSFAGTVTFAKTGSTHAFTSTGTATFQGTTDLTATTQLVVLTAPTLNFTSATSNLQVGTAGVRMVGNVDFTSGTLTGSASGAQDIEFSTAGSGTTVTLGTFSNNGNATVLGNRIVFTGTSATAFATNSQTIKDLRTNKTGAAVTLNGQTLTAANVTLDSNLTSTGAGTATVVTVTGNVNVNSPATLSWSDSRLVLTGSGATMTVASGATVSLATTVANGGTYRGLFFNTAGAAQTLSNSGTITLASSYHSGAPATYSPIHVVGSGATRMVWTGSALTWTGGDLAIGNVNYQPTLLNQQSSASLLYINDSNVQLTALTLAGQMNMDGFPGGVTSYNLALSGNLNYSAGTIVNQNVSAVSTFTFNNTTAVSITTGGVGTGKNLYNLTLAGTGAGNSVTLVGNLGLYGNLSQAATTSFDITGRTVLVQGSVSLIPSAPFTLTSTSSTLVLASSAAAGITLSATASLNDVVVRTSGAFTVTQNSDLTAHRFMAFSGTWDTNNFNLTTTEDFVTYGAGYRTYNVNAVPYNPSDDGEIAATRAAAYYQNKLGYPYFGSGGPTIAALHTLINSAFAAMTLHDGTRTAVPDGTTGSATTASFLMSTGRTLTVGRNFYNYGSSMTAGGVWNLLLPAKWTTTKLNQSVSTDWFGLPFAVAVSVNGSMSVSNSNSNQPIAAAQTSVASITDSGGNTNWDFTRPDVSAVAGAVSTRFDNLVETTFTQNLLNTSGEIQSSVGQATALDNLRFNSGAANATSALTFTVGTLGSAGEYSVAALANSNTNVVSFQTSGITWNTDATGASLGGATSTNRSGVHQTTVPNLTIEKGRFFNVSGNPIVNRDGSNYNGAVLSTRVTSTADKARPVLIKVELGQTSTVQPPVSADDSHNYYKLTWSEPMTLDAASVAGINTVPNSNLPAALAFGDSYGATTVNVSGLFSYSGTLYRSTRTWGIANAGADPTSTQNDAAKVSNGLARATTYDLSVSVAGYSTGAGAGTTWDGFFYSATNPVGQSYSSIYNSNVTDAQGNPIEGSTVQYPSALTDPKVGFTVSNQTAPIAPRTTAWQLDAPAFAAFDAFGSYEVVPIDSDSNDVIEQLQIHLLANRANSGQVWDSTTGHPDTTLLHFGVRDTSLSRVQYGLSLKLSTDAVYTFVNTLGATVGTTVNNNLFTPSLVSNTTVDDGYFSIDLNPLSVSATWKPTLQYNVNYDSFKGMTTDLSGNLLYAPAGTFNAIDRTPPVISLTLAVVKQNKVYVQFSRPVVFNVATPLVTNNGAYTISSITTTNGAAVSGAVQEVILTLNTNIDPDDYFTLKINSSAANAITGAGNPMDTSIQYPISNLAIDMVSPLWASDGLGGETNQTGTARVIHNFTGGEYLTANDIDLQASVAGTAVASPNFSLPLRMFFDMQVPGSVVTNSVWLPSGMLSLITGVVPGTGNSAARYLLPYTQNTSGSLKNFLIPGSDSEMVNGYTMQLLFQLGTLYAVRSTDVTDPRKISVWSVPLKGVKTQKNGVTVLNNVIDPTKGQETQVLYTMKKAGVVTIQVFALDGSIVKILHRGRQAPGDYSVFWDGKNEGGNIVARGIYFVRVVAPDIDETRNILVIK